MAPALVAEPGRAAFYLEFELVPLALEILGARLGLSALWAARKVRLVLRREFK